MASNKPVVRQIAWRSVLVQLLLFIILSIVFGIMLRSFINGFDLALILFFVASLLLRFLVPQNHRQGVSYYRSGNYAQAISEFEKSYAFFTRHAWIDKYRCIILLSSSKISYTEMALVNIAFCYTQMGDGNKAKEYYEKALSQFPDSGIAQTALQMIHAAADSSSGQEQEGSL